MTRPPSVWQLPLHALVELLPLPDQVRLCLTSGSVRASCLCHVRRWGPRCWQIVREKVAELLSKDGPHSVLLTASGVSAGSVCRALGSALDVVERLTPQPLLADVALLALAVVRYSLKFELTLD